MPYIKYTIADFAKLHNSLSPKYKKVGFPEK